MRFKKSKQETLRDISARVYTTAPGMPDLDRLSPNQWKGAIENYANNAAKSAVENMLLALFDNLYSEEEFERDIGLSNDESKSRT